jgi:ParB/RepB/Spo0J family partition protein
MKTTEIEFHQIEQKYSNLSILNASFQSKLMVSLAEYGQQSPVFVTETSSDNYVLIDGYRRVKALLKLKRDTVKATVLALSEQEALLLKHRLGNQQRRSAIEEAWLFLELMETHHLSLGELSQKLNKSKSWVSRRISLVTILPEKVQNSIKKGKISPQASMKYLVPLARANKSDCEKLVEKIKDMKVSVRQMRQLYISWKQGNSQQKQAIIKNPDLYFKVNNEIDRKKRISLEKEKINPISNDLRIIINICKRIHKIILNDKDNITTVNHYINDLWDETERTFQILGLYFKKRRTNA